MQQTQACAIGGRRRCGTACAVASSGSFAVPAAVKVVGPRQLILRVPVLAARKVYRQFRSSPHMDDEDSTDFSHRVLGKDACSWGVFAVSGGKCV